MAHFNLFTVCAEIRFKSGCDDRCTIGIDVEASTVFDMCFTVDVFDVRINEE